MKRKSNKLEKVSQELRDISQKIVEMTARGIYGNELNKLTKKQSELTKLQLELTKNLCEKEPKDINSNSITLSDYIKLLKERNDFLQEYIKKQMAFGGNENKPQKTLHNFLPITPVPDSLMVVCLN